MRARFGLWIVRILITWVFLELAIAGGLYLLELKVGSGATGRPFALSADQRAFIRAMINHGPTGYFEYDSDLGWTVKRSLSGGMYRTNRAGLRATHEYDLATDPKRIRIAAFGSSFTYCNWVANEDSWEEVLERSHPNLDVMNFGVSGYGTDQSYLRYLKDGVRYHPDQVWIEVVADNMRRNVNVFRGFLSEGLADAIAKPRFVLRSGSLELLKNPLPSLSDYQDLLENTGRVTSRLGQNDYFYHVGNFESGLLPSIALIHRARRAFGHEAGESPVDPSIYGRNSEAYQVTLRLLRQFAANAVANGSKPVIIFSPSMDDLEAVSGHPARYAALETALRAEGVNTVDLVDAFAGVKKQDLGSLYNPHFHLSERGNHLVASYLYSKLLQPPGSESEP